MMMVDLHVVHQMIYIEDNTAVGGEKPNAYFFEKNIFFKNMIPLCAILGYKLANLTVVIKAQYSTRRLPSSLTEAKPAGCIVALGYNVFSLSCLVIL